MRTMVLAALALVAASAGAKSALGAPGPVPFAGARPDPPAAVPYAGAFRQQDPQDQRGLSVRVWTEDERDSFSPGDRTRVFVRTSAAAYVAVLHIDPSGNLEVLYPSSPRDPGYLRQGRLYALPESGYWTLRGAPGLGYVFAVASDRPLDLGAIRDLYAGRSGAGEHVVFGDPFEVMDRMGRRLARYGGEGGYATDSYSYQLGGRFSYPRYACYDSYGSWYYGRTSQYGSCDRVRVALRDDPSYYDTRGRRADRRTYADQRDAHTYKEDPRFRDDGSTRRPSSGARPADNAPPPPARRDDGGDRDAS
ncbi:MAG: hypothetical protein JWM27_2617, partial [Gemmatimonadetes bacterium]|nr:hypothetical protein [Gemmatimonadota bacterium]